MNMTDENCEIRERQRTAIASMEGLLFPWWPAYGFDVIRREKKLVEWLIPVRTRPNQSESPDSRCRIDDCVEIVLGRDGDGW